MTIQALAVLCAIGARIQHLQQEPVTATMDGVDQVLTSHVLNVTLIAKNVTKETEMTTMTVHNVRPLEHLISEQ